MTLAEIKSNMNSKWWLRGLVWGFFMLIAMTILWPLMDGSGIRLSKILIGVPVWIAAGLLYGFLIHVIERRRINKE